MPSVLDQLTQAVATQADRIDALVETSNDLKARVADAIARLEQAINDATDTTTLTAILNALTANTEQIEAVTDELANVPLPTDPNAPEVPEPSEEG